MRCPPIFFLTRPVIGSIGEETQTGPHLWARHIRDPSPPNLQSSLSLVQPSWTSRGRGRLQHRYRLPPARARPVQRRPSVSGRHRRHLRRRKSVHCDRGQWRDPRNARVNLCSIYHFYANSKLRPAPSGHGSTVFLRPSLCPRRSHAELSLQP